MAKQFLIERTLFTDIIRAVHLIPDFQSGPSNNLLNFTKSGAHDSNEHWDWKHYYVNRFVDQDILMRYSGGGIGHYQYTIRDSENNPDSEQNKNTNCEVPLEMRGEAENIDAESEDEGSDAGSEDGRSNGNESICLEQDEVGDEELSMDEGVSEFGDDVSEDGMEGYIIDRDGDDLYGF
ncbi:hypothetical protein OPQ81_010398 [Rhizoctonia solani]|nr:hypothetical protein OPQ81_010398 [Rhizoctonia solani]